LRITKSDFTAGAPPLAGGGAVEWTRVSQCEQTNG